MDCSPIVEPDYTGVPLFQLRAIIEANRKGRSKFWLAEMTGISQKELARILTKAKPTAVLGLHKCDKILSAMGLNVTNLEQRDELNVVPLGGSRVNAIKMARDIVDIRELGVSEYGVHSIAESLMITKSAILALAA